MSFPDGFIEISANDFQAYWVEAKKFIAIESRKHERPTYDSLMIGDLEVCRLFFSETEAEARARGEVHEPTIFYIRIDNYQTFLNSRVEPLGSGASRLTPLMHGYSSWQECYEDTVKVGDLYVGNHRKYDRTIYRINQVQPPEGEYGLRVFADPLYLKGRFFPKPVFPGERPTERNLHIEIGSGSNEYRPVRAGDFPPEVMEEAWRMSREWTEHDEKEKSRV